MAAHDPTIFDTTPIAADDPLLLRPYSTLPLDALVDAARIVTEYPGAPGIQKYRPHVVTLRITPDEYDRLIALRASIRAEGVLQAPSRVHSS